jgi:hypothetical protein
MARGGDEADWAAGLTPEIAEHLRLARSSPTGVYDADWSGSFRPPSKRPRLSVILTCHRPYLPFLPRAISAIEAQSYKAHDKALVLDGCAHAPREGWTVFCGDWKSPNPARDAGLDLTHGDWCVFADADDVMDPDYLAGCARAIEAASERTGIVYADLRHTCDGHVYRTPERWDAFELRRYNYVSSTAAWRRTAIAEAGGWPRTERYDDWTLALEISRRGWTGVRNEVSINVTDHADDRHRMAREVDGRDWPHLWKYRTYTIATLLAGRTNLLAGWLSWLATADLPPRCELAILDNGCDQGFTDLARRELLAVAPRFQGIRYRVSGRRPTHEALEYATHAHVAKLYNEILPAVDTDMVVFLEDDVLPPVDGLRRLAEAYPLRRKVGAVGGIYASRSGQGRIVGAAGPGWWRNILTYADLPADGLVDVGFLAGGFTLANAGVVRRCLPFRFDFIEGKYAAGWDSHFSLDCRALGYELKLHAGVRCDHRYSGREGA